MNAHRHQRSKLIELADRVAAIEKELRALIERPEVSPLVKQSPEYVQDRVDRGLCLTCDNPSVYRGLCASCRRTATQKVDRGEYSETDFIEAGMLLPAKPAGRPPKSGFAKSVTGGQATAELLAAESIPKADQKTGDVPGQSHLERILNRDPETPRSRRKPRD